MLRDQSRNPRSLPDHKESTQIFLALQFFRRIILLLTPFLSSWLKIRRIIAGKELE
jgi:hypothetical protein